MNPSDGSDAEPGVVAPSSSRRGPSRTCVGCRQAHAKWQLMRLVCGPTGELTVDLHGKLPGRGVYICPQRACIARALKGTLVRDALRQEVVSVSPDVLVEGLVRALEARAVACIHMARKAGRAVAGYTQVLRALAHKPVTFMLMAGDAAPERVRDYTARCVRRQIPSRSFLTKARLGAFVGRSESSAIGILDTRLSEHLRWYLEGMSRLTDR